MKKKIPVEIRISRLGEFDVIGIYSPPSIILNERLKGIDDVKYDSIDKFWYLKLDEYILKKVYNSLKDIAQIKFHPGVKNRIRGLHPLDQNQIDILDAFKIFLETKRFARSTVELYYSMVKGLFIFMKSRNDTHDICNQDIENYTYEVIVKRKYSISYQRQFIGAIKQLTEMRPQYSVDSFELHRPKKDKKLPKVISQEEVIAILQATVNIKHRSIIAMIYSSGLRISEVLNLKLNDLDFIRMQIHIKSSKGRKDRYVPIAKSLLSLLDNYIMGYKPKEYLFFGPKYQKYSPTSVRTFLKQNAKKANIRKVITPHMLRHSYATHLLENGTDIRYIQELLGHAKPETTMIYTHVTKKDLMNVESPLDTAIKNLKKRMEDNTYEVGSKTKHFLN